MHDKDKTIYKAKRKQDKVGQGRAGQYDTRQDKKTNARQYKRTHEKTRHEYKTTTRQDKTTQDKTRQDSHKTGQEQTAKP
jgi:hypothetical protein